MIDGSREYAFAHLQASQCALNLAHDRSISLVFRNDQNLFAALFVALASLLDIPSFLSDDIMAQAGGQPDDSDGVRKLFRDLQRDYGAGVTAKYAGLFFTGIITFNLSRRKPEIIDNLVSYWTDKHHELAAENLSSNIEVNVERLGDLLKLNNAERGLLEFSIQRTTPTFNILFNLLQSYDSTRRIIFNSTFSHFNQEELARATSADSPLFKSGLLPFDKQREQFRSLSSFWLEALNKSNVFDTLMIPLRRKSTSGSIARLGEVDEQIITRILAQAVVDEEGFLGPAENKEPMLGYNMLCYGSRKIDKKALIFDLLLKLRRKGWTTSSTQLIDSNAMPSVCYIAQRWLRENHPDDVLVIDGAEKVLVRSTGSFMSMFFDADEEVEVSEGRKELDEHVLLDNPAVTIWLTDKVDSLTQENVGRFIYHCEVKAASRKMRREGIEKAIAHLELPEEFASGLAKYTELSEQQVASAAKLATLISTKKDYAEMLSSAIDRSQKALNRLATEELRAVVTTYSLDYLNIEGQFKPATIIESLRKKRKGTLCLYGIPGTGKTQLAEHIAIELDMPLVKKRGSDLLSKWVGENEQNIADMFREAKDEDAILLLDEADSFLRDRSMARSGWEVTMVNELLQQMERYNGIFICATNLFEQLDAASLRRFTFKLEFKELKEPQRWAMFQNETNLSTYNLSTAELQALQDEIKSIEFLTPGDFATVKRQMQLLDDKLDPTQWVEQLKIEATTKLAGLKRNKMGFVAN